MKRLILAGLVVMLAGSICYAETGKDAVRALMKLEARCEAGISYRDFAPAIGDAKFDVNMFLQSKEAKNKPDLSASVTKTMGHYMAANSVWAAKFAYNQVQNFVPVSEDTVKEFLSLYPETNKNYHESGGILDRIMFVQSAHIDSAVSHALSKASEELKIATALLAKSSATQADKIEPSATVK